MTALAFLKRFLTQWLRPPGVRKLNENRDAGLPPLSMKTFPAMSLEVMLTSLFKPPHTHTHTHKKIKELCALYIIQSLLRRTETINVKVLNANHQKSQFSNCIF